MAVEVVDITEGLAAHVTAMVLFHRLGGLLGDALLLLVLVLVLVLHGGHDASARGRGGGGCGQDASYGGDVRGVPAVLPWYGGDERHHGGRRLHLFGPRHHLDAGVAGLMPPQVVAVPEGLVAVAADEGRLGFGLLLDYSDGGPSTASTSSPSPAGHIVLEEFGGTYWGLLVQGNGQHWLLIRWLSSRVKEWQEAVSGHLVLVMQGLIGLL